MNIDRAQELLRSAHWRDLTGFTVWTFISGKGLPSWQQLPEETREQWRTAGSMTAELILELLRNAEGDE